MFTVTSNSNKLIINMYYLFQGPPGLKGEIGLPGRPVSRFLALINETFTIKLGNNLKKGNCVVEL